MITLATLQSQSILKIMAQNNNNNPPPSIINTEKNPKQILINGRLYYVPDPDQPHKDQYLRNSLYPIPPMDYRYMPPYGYSSYNPYLLQQYPFQYSRYNQEMFPERPQTINYLQQGISQGILPPTYPGPNSAGNNHGSYPIIHPGNYTGNHPVNYPPGYPLGYPSGSSGINQNPHLMPSPHFPNYSPIQTPGPKLYISKKQKRQPTIIEILSQSEGQKDNIQKNQKPMTKQSKELYNTKNQQSEKNSIFKEKKEQKELKDFKDDQADKKYKEYKQKHQIKIQNQLKQKQDKINERKDYRQNFNIEKTKRIHKVKKIEQIQVKATNRKIVTNKIIPPKTQDQDKNDDQDKKEQKSKTEERLNHRSSKYLDSHGKIRIGRDFQSDISDFLSIPKKLLLWRQIKRKNLLSRQIQSTITF